MNIKPIKTFDSIDNLGEVKQYNIYDNDSLIFMDDVTLLCGFALRVNKDKREGTYVEIGAGHFKIGNNTFFLENLFDWKGVAIDKQKNYADLYNQNRKNLCLHDDAMTYDWKKYFEQNNFPKQIDFLQIDIDHNPEHANLIALINLPLTNYRFTTISIEHDTRLNYKFKSLRNAQREILSGLGYRLVYPGDFNDLWVDSKFIPNMMETITITGQKLSI